MSDGGMAEGYNEFIKEYGLRENWRIEIGDVWDVWDSLFAKSKPIGKQRRSSAGEKKYLNDLYTVYPP